MKRLLLISSICLSSCSLYESEPSSMEIIEAKSKEDICRPPLKCPYSEEAKAQEKTEKKKALSREQLIAKEKAYEARLIEDIPNLHVNQICMMGYSLEMAAIHEAIGEALGHKRDVEIGAYWSVARAYNIGEKKAAQYIDYLNENRDILHYKEQSARSRGSQRAFLNYCSLNPKKYLPKEMYDIWINAKR